MGSKRCVVAHLYGGLGNQLFIFAAAWALARRHNADLWLDASAFWRDRRFKRKYALAIFEGTRKLEFHSFFVLDIIAKFYSKLMSVFPFLPSKLGPLFCEAAGKQMSFDNKWNCLNLSDAFPFHVFGYRQNEGYFGGYADELKDTLSLTFQPSAELRQFSNTLRMRNTVSVSFRRHFNPNVRRATHDREMETLDAKYYQKAVTKICEMVESPVFLCFGDGLDEVDTLLPSHINRIIPPSTADMPADIRDFWLMLQCRHFIIANSTFSWWAAWLGQRTGTVVVCPHDCAVGPASHWHVIASKID